MRRLMLASMISILMLTGTYAQYGNSSEGLPYHKIYAYGMDANIRPALEILAMHPLSNEHDTNFQKRFMTRFGEEVDEGDYESTGDAQMDELLSYFRVIGEYPYLTIRASTLITWGRKWCHF